MMRRFCLHDGVPDCAAAETLLHVIDNAKAHQGKALIADARARGARSASRAKRHKARQRGSAFTA